MTPSCPEKDFHSVEFNEIDSILRPHIVFPFLFGLQWVASLRLFEIQVERTKIPPKFNFSSLDH